MISRRVTIGGALALSLIAAGFAAAAAPPKRNPFLGQWEYVPEGSKFAGRLPYRSATITFAAEGTSLRVIEDVVTANGAKFHFEYVDPLDGTFVAVEGNPYYDSESTAWTSARVLTRTERRAGERTGATVMTVAPDGESFIADARRTTPEGRLYTAYVIWKRARGTR